ncbi:MAG: DUF3524 domain-containing protein, partial [Phycisphaerae bacterium]|nr:DUF3524 domain-containing protein [Phycisphaerae bacterium]
SDMLNLAEFRGLVPESVRRLPHVVYFHENQLTYPFRFMGERDLHFGFVNMTTALAADAVWFNSAFHRDDFLGALHKALRKMPDYHLPDVVKRIRSKSSIEPLGIREIAPADTREPGPARILWVARWEHDKDPDSFFAAIRQLRASGVDFRLSVIGEQYAESPDVFDAAREEFADHIDHWGYQATRTDYENVLRAADLVVSTARHEFFGVSIVEAIAAGAWPVLPRRLAYPEIVGPPAIENADASFYAGDADSLARRLAKLIARHAGGDLWQDDALRVRRAVERFFWPRRAADMDAALERLSTNHL